MLFHGYIDKNVKKAVIEVVGSAGVSTAIVFYTDDNNVTKALLAAMEAGASSSFKV
ncbi:MAG TPA: hypothetical protein P5323_03540 [Candidatus Moranbacteria bacterium]|nr:hypothetical protein [Candidatus Moranbacteria bacterium]HRY28185.1 hypothetical protein [Candidatus Moranbacteria bacterium]